LPEGTVASLLKPENREKLAAILKYHVISGRVFSDAALQAGQAETLQGGKVTIAASDNGVMVDRAKLIATDIDASNGVIHVIDSVILPGEKDTAAVSPRQMMEEAVAHGSQLYNSGHAGACAEVYSQAMRRMLNLEDHGMSPHAVRAINTALHRAENTHCSQSQAWILRHGLDTAYRSMSTSLVKNCSVQ
jgi:hypothetical protein